MPSPVRPPRGTTKFPPPKKSSRYVDEDDDFIDDEDDDVPVTPKRRPAPPPPPTKKSARYVEEDDDDDGDDEDYEDDDIPPPRTKRKDVEETPLPKPKRRVVEDEDDDEEVSPPKRRTSGWGGVKEAKEASANLYEGIPQDFWLLSGEESYIQFLDDAPVCYDAHTVFIDGKRKTLPCQKEHKATCLMCNDGVRSQFVAAMRVLDFRGSWDKNANRGKGEFTHDKPVEKVFRMSKGVAIQLEEYKEKRGIKLTKTVLLISKSGTAKTTRWNIERALDDADNPIRVVKHTSIVSSLEDVIVKVSDKYLIANHFENGEY